LRVERAGASARVLALSLCALTLALLPARANGAASRAKTAALAWGGNFRTELGAGYKDTRETAPVSVVGLSSVATVAAAYDFNLALLSGGTVEAWGGNDFGQLGDGTRVASRVPVPVSGLKTVAAISAAGTHAMALLNGGTVDVWGSNEYGELGNGQLNPRERINQSGEKETTMAGTASTEPVEVPGLTNVVAVAAGGGTDFALLANGSLMAWGKNDVGQLGIGETGPEVCKTSAAPIPCSTTPRPVVLTSLPSGVTVAAVSAGQQDAYALLSNHEVRAWGDNMRGELGDGLTTASDVPVEVLNVSGGGGSKGLSNATAVSAGSGFVLALLETGQVVAWGTNESGQLGAISSNECRAEPCSQTPIFVAGIEKITRISAGESGFSVVEGGGSVYSFGRNSPWGQLGIGLREAPEACGQEGLTRERTLWCARTPVRITGLGPLAGIVAGEQGGVALIESKSGPPPLLSVDAEAHAIRVFWTFQASEYRLRSKLLTVRKWSKPKRLKESCGAENPCSYQLADASGTPLEIQLTSYTSEGKQEKRRIILGSPAPENSAPANVAAPSIKGDGLKGHKLVESHGAWTNKPTHFTYQWVRCNAGGEGCSGIRRATKEAYAPGSIDVNKAVRVEEKATNGHGRATVETSGPIHVLEETEPEEPVALENSEELE
jgi:alpha-tubulin suppressor-like RCC1 family protein